MILATAAVLASWFVLVWLLAGIGLPVVRAMRGRQADLGHDDLLVAPLLGMSVVIAFLQIWHGWLPVNAWGAAPLVALGLLGLFSNGSVIRRAASAAFAHPLALAAFAAIVILLANRAIGPGDAYDSGQYHYALIKWTNTYPIVPGLGNLRLHFGYNAASLLWHALLNATGSPWEGRANHLGNGVWLMLVLGVATAGIIRVWRKRVGHVTAADLYAALLVAPVLMVAFTKEISSPRTDAPVAMTGFVAVWLWLKLLSATTRVERRAAVLSIAMLAATLVCLKLSAGVMAAALSGAAAIIWFRRERRPWPVLAGMTVLSMVLVLPWVGRNIVLTGYPLYPAGAFGANVDWKVPEATVEGTGNVIRNWARAGIVEFTVSATDGRVPLPLVAVMQRANSRDAGPISQWILPWCVSMLFAGPLYVVAPMLVIIIVTLAAVFRRRGGSQFWMSVAPPAIASVVWLVTVPEPRFGYSLLWAWATVASALMLSQLPRISVVRAAIVAACATVVIAAAGLRAVEDSLIADAPPFDTVPFYAAGPDHGFHPLSRLPLPGMLWDAPLMTIPPAWDAPMVKLRSAVGDLSKGFASSAEPWRAPR